VHAAPAGPDDAVAGWPADLRLFLPDRPIGVAVELLSRMQVG